jgi:hypothetical protein
MIEINDDLFDDKIRKRLKDEINYVPNDINQKIDSTLNKINKKRFTIKKACCILVSCIGVTLLLGMAMPTYASNIPIIGNIFKMFTNKTYENYDEYASDLNITKESSGLKMTIDKVVYDEVQLSIFYTIESEKEIQDTPRFPGAKLRINGKETTFSAGGTGKLMNDNKTFAGSIEYNVSKHNSMPKEFQNEHFLGGYVEIPDKFVLNLDIDEIGLDNPIKGTWNFNIPVSSEKVNGKVNEKECDIDLSNLVSGYHINKIITTPLNTVIQGTRMDDEENADRLSFAVFDNKGRYITNKSEEAVGDKDKDGNYIMYFSNGFKEIYDDTDYLTFIPWKYKNNDSHETDNNIAEKLNLKGETKLYSSDGKEYITITKVHTEDGKTKIYYKSRYGVNAAPIEIVDNKTGENIISFSDDYNFEEQKEATTYNADTDEYTITCNKEIKDGDYSVKTIDKSKSIEVYGDEKFTIKIK